MRSESIITIIDVYVQALVFIIIILLKKQNKKSNGTSLSLIANAIMLQDIIQERIFVAPFRSIRANQI